jgi:hypothetical protein
MYPRVNFMYWLRLPQTLENLLVSSINCNFKDILSYIFMKAVNSMKNINSNAKVC